MPINDPNAKALPIPNYKPPSNNEISKKVANSRPKMQNMPLDYRHEVELKVSEVERAQQIKNKNNEFEIPGRTNVNSGIGDFPIKSVYTEPKVPDLFPQTVDKIKSLNFNASSLTPDAKSALSKYYGLALQLMNGEITVNQYYQDMPKYVESIRGVVLNETDWENMRDAILRTQNYILHYIWTDMQKVSKAMDSGFAQYQDSINKWIDQANSWYSGDNYLAKGSVKLEALSNKIDSDNGYGEVMQNVDDLMKGMVTRVSATQPIIQYKTGDTVRNGDFPKDKQLVWIELIP